MNHAFSCICRCYVELLQTNTLEGICIFLWKDFSSICSFQWSSCEKFNWIIYLGTRYVYTCTLFINTHIALYSMKSNRRCYFLHNLVKFMFSKKATKIDKIFPIDLTATTYCQIDDEDLFNFCGLLRKRELYMNVSLNISLWKWKWKKWTFRNDFNPL